MSQFEIGWNGPTLVLVGVIGFVLVTAGAWITRKAPLLLRVVLFMVLSALISAAYFAYVQRRAGLSDDVLADPTELIEKARQVKRQAQRRNREIQRSLRALERPKQRSRPKREEPEE